MSAASTPAETTVARAVVEGDDRHGFRVADEFQSFTYATARPGVKPRAGDVVSLQRIASNKYTIEQVLPYARVDSVRHPEIPGLRGIPVVDTGHPGMFSVRGQVYVRQGEAAHTQVQSWLFESGDAEADYLSSVLKGASELPGVQLSLSLRQRAASLGLTLGNLERVAEERRRVQALQQALNEKTKVAAEAQLKAQQSSETLSIKVEKAEGELKTLLDGIKDAEEEKKNLGVEIKAQRTEAQRDSKLMITDARKEAKKIRETAQKYKKEAEEAAREATQKTEGLIERAAGLRQVLERQQDGGAARRTVLERLPYGAAEEIPALQAALGNLRQARGTAPEQLVALHVGLKHAPFTVLAGPSGSGKTSLTLAYAQQMGIHVTTVAVQPGWTSVQDLHGYVNPLRPGEYRSTPFFEALGYQVRQSQAARLRGLLQGAVAETPPDQASPIPLDLVLLDEINLSHVEYFLADYLSAFELDSRNVAVTTPDEALKLALDQSGGADEHHPLAWLRHLGGQLDVPRSFLIVGTANEDDTTRGFSDKFRDRTAFLHVEAPQLATAILQRPREVTSGLKYVPQHTWDAWLRDGANAEMNERLVKFSDALNAARLPVSVRLFQRTARMSGDARRLLEALEVPSAPKVALDLAVSLGIAHKYAQLTEGRAPEVQHKRKLLREALEGLLAGRQQATFSALGWSLEA